MINRHAVLHIPLSQYAFANSETNLTIRLRAAKDNLLKCILYYGDRVHPKDPIEFYPMVMKKIASDKYFDYFDGTFETKYPRVCYYFELFSKDEKLLYYADLFEENIPLERWEFYQYPFVRREEISQVPQWFKTAVVYNIFPDSFASNYRQISAQPSKIITSSGLVLNSRLGGTIKGIEKNLDYISNMGFNCIYLNPIFMAGEYHKYDLLDYFHIDPCMGTDGDFLNLVNKAHSIGIKVIIDGVFNHCSWYFFAFDDVVKNGENSKYKDWFYGLKFPVVRPQDEQTNHNYISFAYEKKMPKLNTSNPEVIEYFKEVYVHWIKNFDIDGWRLDVANEVDRNFWREFKKAGKNIKPDSLMIGEIWESSEPWLRGDMFDSTMNYDFRKNCRDFFALGKISPKEFDSRITQMNLRYPKGIVQGQLNLLDSHDTSRFLYLCGGDYRKLKLALIFLFTSIGVPSVFYGDELGMDGGTELDWRKPMPWGSPQYDMVEFFKDLCGLRKYDAIINGDFLTIQAENTGLYIYERIVARELIRVIINNSHISHSVNCSSNDEIILSNLYNNSKLSSYGFIIIKKVSSY